MASNQKDDINKHIRHRRHTPRSKSTHRKNENDIKMQLSRSHSVEQPDKKILNVESKFYVFINVSEAFENILNQLEMDENCEEVNKKLLEIQNLIKQKINYFKLKNKEQNKLKFNLEIKNLSTSKSLASSMQSIYSECSEIDSCLNDDKLFSDFLINVSCPFCSESQDNKVTFIKHLDENCEPHKNCKFEKTKHMPFSTFQILPNNSFKCNVCPNSVQCNIKKYFIHLHSEKHVSAYVKAAQTKFFSEHLFCSCCKIQVANTYTQLDFHIKHGIHKFKSSNAPSSDNYLQRKIQCVYLKSRKFKCLVCPHSQSSYDTPKEILQHLEQKTHIRNNRSHFLMFYCEFCAIESHIFEIINHFNWREHKRNVEEYRENIFEGNFEICFYCGFICNDLMALSNHMKSKCSAMNEIREKHLKTAKPEVKNSQETKDSNNSKGGVVEKEEFYIIVKDNLEITKLFKHFMKFGEIIGISTYNKSDVKIKFREEKTVKDILLLRNVLQMDGVKLEVTTDEKLSKSANTTNDDGETLDKNKKVSTKLSDERDDDSSADEDNKLQDLFQRVSGHLLNTTQKTDSKLQEKLVKDCIKTLEVERCKVVGFSGCGLSFPVENINFYCEEKNTVHQVLPKVKFKLDSYYRKMCISDLWNKVTIAFEGPVSYIECVHKETLKACTVTYNKCAMTLTNMLRDCLENKKIVQDFCLIIRFWLSIHELKIRDFEYTIISIIVFFLIKENVVNIPLYKYSLPEIELYREIFEEDFRLSKPLTSLPDSDFNVKKLFHRFLLFLESFDFDKNAICLPIDFPVPKSVIKSVIEKDRDELLKSSLWIFNPVLFGENLASEVTEYDINSLLKIVKNTIKHYKIQ